MSENHPLKTIDMCLPIGSLDAYYLKVNSLPMLTAEREHELAMRFFQHQDREAARELVLAHLRYVVRVARNYLGYGLPLADLVQEGNIGLMKAVRRFDPHVGVRLVSFAIHWIKAEIHDFIVKNWRIVKIATTKAQRKLFFNLRSLTQKPGWLTPNEVSEIAKDLGVSEKEVLRMEHRLNSQDTALEGTSENEDGQTGANGDTQNFYPIHYLASPHATPEEWVMRLHQEHYDQGRLYHAITQLDTRSQEILKERWLNPTKATLQELALKYHVSAERIRQLETNALKKLKILLAVE